MLEDLSPNLVFKIDQNQKNIDTKTLTLMPSFLDLNFPPFGIDFYLLFGIPKAN